MKTNRKTWHCLLHSDRLLSAVIAAVLVLTFAGQMQRARNIALAQAKRKSTGSSNHRPREPQLRSYQFDTVTVDSRGAITTRRKGQARSYIEDINRVALEMVEIPGGTFTMGSTNAGIWCGSYSRSASWMITMSPAAPAIPVRSAAPFP